MNKATIIMISLAALAIGALIGVSLVNDEGVDEPMAAVVSNNTAQTPAASSGGAPVFRYIAPGDVTVELDDFGSPLPSADGENFISRDRQFKTETVVIDLALDESVEYKAIMQQGDALVFNWKTNRGNVYYDYHGHDEAFGAEFFTRYDEGEGPERSGSIVAPYSGQHGWFFLNIEDGPTTVTLEVAGFYDEIIEIELEGY